MIIGKLKDIGQYKGISSNLDNAIDYIVNTDLSALENGKSEIDGDRIKLIKDEYVARDFSDCYFEGHRKYIDIQIVLKGKEYFGYSDIKSLQSGVEYNVEKDLEKFVGDLETKYLMSDNSFAIVFPEDIHMPKIKINDEKVEKLVFKVKL